MKYALSEKADENRINTAFLDLNASILGPAFSTPGKE